MNQEKEKNNNGIDLSGSFNDSDEKFNKQRPQTPLYLPGTPKVIQWVIKYSGGLIKDEKQAQYVILGFIVLTIIISLFLFFLLSAGGIDIPPEALENPEYGLPVAD